MTTFASILLGALWCVASGLIGYGAHDPNKEAAAIVGATLITILAIITLFFILAINAPTHA